MAGIRLRFSGRFVLAEPSAPGSQGVLNALALAMPSDNEQNRHRVLMATGRANMPEQAPPGFLSPTFSLIGPGKGKSTEHVVWDLSGWNVATTGTKGKFSWNSGTPGKLPDLAKLEALRKESVVFRRDHVRTNTSAVSAMIQVSSGSGNAPVWSKKKYNFAPKNNLGKRLYTEAQSLADIVDVKLAASRLRFELTSRADSATKKVVDVVAPASEEAVVRFSNLCPGGPASLDDQEFTAYYGLFDHRAPNEELLIALEAPPFGEWGTACFLMVYATYE